MKGAVLITGLVISLFAQATKAAEHPARLPPGVKPVVNALARFGTRLEKDIGKALPGLPQTVQRRVQGIVADGPAFMTSVAASRGRVKFSISSEEHAGEQRFFGNITVDRGGPFMEVARTAYRRNGRRVASGTLAFYGEEGLTRVRFDGLNHLEMTTKDAVSEFHMLRGETELPGGQVAPAGSFVVRVGRATGHEAFVLTPEGARLKMEPLAAHRLAHTIPSTWAGWTR